MDPLERNKTHQLKKELDYTKKALAKWNSLMQKREELEIKIDQMRLEKREKVDEMKLLKNHLRELDTLLDHLEEHSPDKISQLEHELIASLLLDPTLREEYDEILNSLSQAEHKFKNLELLYQKLNHIHELLEGSLAARQMVRKRGILSYIFGANPNQIISQHLRAIDEQIHLILPLQDQEIDLFLRNLQKESKTRWGFRKMDTFFKEAHSYLGQILTKVQNELNTCEKQAKEIKKLKENWITEKSQ